MGDASEPLTSSTRASLPSINPTKSFWQTSHPNPTTNFRSTPELPSKADVIVIGSGITGAFATRTLLSGSRDINVLVLEARTTCSGATGRNGGHLQPLVHDQPSHIVDFELRNFGFIENLIAENKIECDFRKLKGCIGFWNHRYFEEAKTSIENSRKTAPEHANLVRIIENEEDLRKLKLNGAIGAVVQSTAASLSPYKLVTWLWQDMLKTYSRLNLQTTTPVTSLTKNGDGQYLIQTERGMTATSHVVLATNGYTSHLLESFDGLIVPTQGQMSALRPPSSLSDRLLDLSYGFLGVGQQDDIMSDYLVQNPLSGGGHLMFGGGRQNASGHGVAVSDDSFVEPMVEEYLRNLPRLLDLESDETYGMLDSKLDIDGSWTGVMGYSKDGHPWVGSIPGLPGIFLCGGYTGHGMTNAGLCGKHIGELVLTSLQGNDWHLTEREALQLRGFPPEYVISETRMRGPLVNIHVQ